MILPTKEECLKILEENNVPDNIVAHLRKVHEVSMKVVDAMQKKGTHVNRDLVSAAALLHDVRKMSKGDHVTEGSEYVKSLGYTEVGNVIKKHGLVHIKDDEFYPKTYEEKIVFYSDKRCNGDKLVSIEERFEYIRKKYDRPEVDEELKLTKEIEKELLGSEKIN